MLKKGVLIVLEGIDGAGKSTQARLLLKRLRKRGLDAVYFREPSKGKWGREIKRKAKQAASLTPGEELDLFLKDRRDNVEKNLNPALRQKKIVVLDRYYFSTIAYQGARGIEQNRIRRLNEAFAPRPDLVFILDLAAREGLARIQGRKKKDKLFERAAYLVKVGRIFRSFKGRRFFHVHAGRDQEEISETILEKTLRYLKKSKL